MTPGVSPRYRLEEHLRIFMEASPCPMVVVNEEGRIVLANSQTEKLFEHKREELIGRPVEILLPESCCVGFRAEFPTEPETRLLGTGGDLYGLRKDGSIFPVELGLSPIQTDEGTWILSSIVDVSERKSVEAALRESEERFRNMADTAPVMIWIAGPYKLRTFFNKGWLDFRGRTMEQELGDGWAQGLHPEDLERCMGTYRAAFDARRSFQVEYRLLRADGQYRWIVDDGVPRFEPGGVFAGYIGSCADITEIKRTQEEEFRSQKLESLGTLIGGIAHDFNNLLGDILANAELALGHRAQEASGDEEVQRIRAVAIRAAELVRELMIYAGQDKANREPIDLSLLVEEMIELLKISISKRAVLKSELDKGLPAVMANPAQIRQVVMNLILNASEALGTEGGLINIKTSRVASNQRDCLLLEVSDTGRGITPDVQARIFDPFFTTKFAGRGLGLAVVQSIVRMHNGAIHIQSAPGNGTRFEILLPCASQAASKEQSAIVPASTERIAPFHGTLLLVEDEEGLRIAVAKMLRKRGFSVIEAADGSVARELFLNAKDEIDVILMDMTIPGMSSHEVIAEARRIRPDVKVILTSACSREASLSADTPAIKDFIRKPYQIRELTQLLQHVLSAGGQ